MKDLYYDVNGTRCFPRTLREAFPHDMDPNPFGNKTYEEKNLDNIVSFVVIFFLGFIFGMAYVSG